MAYEWPSKFLKAIQIRITRPWKVPPGPSQATGVEFQHAKTWSKPCPSVVGGPNIGRGMKGCRPPHPFPPPLYCLMLEERCGARMGAPPLSTTQLCVVTTWFGGLCSWFFGHSPCMPWVCKPQACPTRIQRQGHQPVNGLKMPCKWSVNGL